MGAIEISILACLQGITEFLPVSSSGHLRAAAEILGIQGSTLAIDVSVHVGTLFAVIIYFLKDITKIASGLIRLLGGRNNEYAQLGIYVGIATIPIFLVGLIGREFIDGNLRGLEVVGWMSIVFGILLFWADRYGITIQKLKHLKLSDSLIIGVAEIFALIPGTSRAGVTITAARALGFERSEATRFSMLLSIPAVAGAGFLVFVDLLNSTNTFVWTEAIVAGVLAFLTALGAIHLLLRWLRTASFLPFIVYRLLMGGAILFWIYWA